MREIEVKAEVREPELLLAALLKSGVVLSEPIKQHDRVWGEPGAKDAVLDKNWLRIRTENDSKHIFTLKKSVVGHLDSIEHETEVLDPEEMEHIITEMHYEAYSDLTKIRRKGHYSEIEICFDEVPGLGTFIEAEKLMSDDADHDNVVEELWNALKSFGIDRSDEVHEGYDVLERKKRGL